MKIDTSALFHYIASAPRDGRKIVVRSDVHGEVVMFWDRIHCVWRDPDGCVIWTETGGGGPTEWCSIN